MQKIMVFKIKNKLLHFMSCRVRWKVIWLAIVIVHVDTTWVYIQSGWYLVNVVHTTILVFLKISL